MARSIPPTMAGVLERLELERPKLVTSADLASMLEDEGIATSVAVFASRMRDRGWLLPTGRRGVWEFVPAEVAGPYSSMDPLMPARALAASRPQLMPARTMHAAAWALGLADRSPATIDVALPGAVGRVAASEGVRLHSYKPTLDTVEAREARTLVPESVIVEMAARPGEVPSWQRAEEWLGELAYESDGDGILTELGGRNASTWARTGYFLQSMRPDVSPAIMGERPPRSKVLENSYVSIVSQYKPLFFQEAAGSRNRDCRHFCGNDSSGKRHPHSLFPVPIPFSLFPFPFSLFPDYTTTYPHRT